MRPLSRDDATLAAGLEDKTVVDGHFFKTGGAASEDSPYSIDTAAARNARGVYRRHSHCGNISSRVE